MSSASHAVALRVPRPPRCWPRGLGSGEGGERREEPRANLVMEEEGAVGEDGGGAGDGRATPPQSLPSSSRLPAPHPVFHAAPASARPFFRNAETLRAHRRGLPSQSSPGHHCSLVLPVHSASSRSSRSHGDTSASHRCPVQERHAGDSIAIAELAADAPAAPGRRSRLPPPRPRSPRPTRRTSWRACSSPTLPHRRLLGRAPRAPMSPSLFPRCTALQLQSSTCTNSIARDVTHACRIGAATNAIFSLG